MATLLTVHQKKEIRYLYHQVGGWSQEALAEKYNTSRWQVRVAVADSSLDDIELDDELVEEAMKARKAHQRAMDMNRIRNKSFRESARIFNAVEAINQELIDVLEAHKPEHPPIVHKEVNGEAVGVIQFSDVHFNEQVCLPHNKYDWDIAARRLRKHMLKSAMYFKAVGVTNVLVAFTGDMLNSDRRLDEVLENATNRSKAIFLAFNILKNILLELNEDFNVTVASICGNEARVGKDIGYVQPIASDNYDYTIFHMLAVALDSDGITFNINDDPTECVVNVAGQNLLLIHGHAGQINKNNPQKSVAMYRAKYQDLGVKIDYIIWGHIHEAHISDDFARSGSSVGPNDYSFKALNLGGRASQNAYIFYDDGSRDGIKNDLSYYEDVDGYDLDDALKTYNSKHQRNESTVVIQKVVI